MAGSRVNSIYTMFRPTHLVILFAVFLCAYAAPAAPEGPAPGKPASGELPPVPVGEGAARKGDLDTDATSYLRYTYYGPEYGHWNSELEARIWALGYGRVLGLGPHWVY